MNDEQRNHSCSDDPDEEWCCNLWEAASMQLSVKTLGWAEPWRRAVWVEFKKLPNSFLCGLLCPPTPHLTSFHCWFTTEWGNGPFFCLRSKKWNQSAHSEVQFDLRVLQTQSHAHVKSTWSQPFPGGLSDEVSRESGWAAGLEDVRAHTPVLRLLRLPVTSLVHKALLSGDWVPPLVKPQWLVAFVFSACRAKHRRYSNCGYVHQRTHWAFTHLYESLSIVCTASNVNTDRGQSWNKNKA